MKDLESKKNNRQNYWHDKPWCPNGCNKVLRPEDYFIKLFLKYPEAHSERGTYSVTCPVCNAAFTIAVDMVPFFNCW